MSRPRGVLTRAGRRPVPAGTAGEQAGDPLFGEAGEVGPGGVEFAVEVVAFAGELVPFGEQVLVFFLEAVALLSDPGAVGLAELAEEPSGQAALSGELMLQIPGTVRGRTDQRSRGPRRSRLIAGIPLTARSPVIQPPWASRSDAGRFQATPCMTSWPLPPNVTFSTVHGNSLK